MCNLCVDLQAIMAPADFNREEVIDQMGDSIAHRGPDSKGSFVDDYVALGLPPSEYHRP